MTRALQARVKAGLKLLSMTLLRSFKCLLREAKLSCTGNKVSSLAEDTLKSRRFHLPWVDMQLEAI